MDDRLPPPIKEKEGHINDGTHLFALSEQQLNSSPIAQALNAIGGGMVDLGNAVVAEIGNRGWDGFKAVGEGVWEGIKAAGQGIKEAFVGQETPKSDPQKESLGKAFSESVKAAIGGAKEGIAQANQKIKEPVNTKELKDRLIDQARQQERLKTARDSQKTERESSANPQPRQASMRSADSSRIERTR